MFVCSVPSFEAAKYKVTNGEFLEFVLADGYNRKELWSEEGWKWKQSRNAKHPRFWICNQGCVAESGADKSGYSHCRDPDIEMSPTGFRFRLMFDEAILPMDWPVEVNYCEAKDYATWRGPDYRLPTEAEQNVIRGLQTAIDSGVICDMHHGDMDANISLRYGSPTPVNLFKANDMGFCDAFGNTWDWVEDQFNGLPSTMTHYMYDDFSTSYYCGKHNVILGGSWITTGQSASKFARFWFRRHFFQHCGFRLARNVPVISEEETIQVLPARMVNSVSGEGDLANLPVLPKRLTPMFVDSTNEQYKYEKPEMVREIIRQEYDILPAENLALKTADHFCKILDRFGNQGDRVLIIGCGAGRFCTEMAVRGPNQILFIDTSELLLAESKKRLEQWIASNGKLDKELIFKQFTWLPNEVGTFDHVLFRSINQCNNPKAWTARFREIVKPGGTVTISAAYKDGTKEDVAAILPDCFDFVELDEISWFDSDHDKHTCAASLWMKRAGENGTRVDVTDT